MLEMVGFLLSAQKTFSRARLFPIGQEALKAVSMSQWSSWDMQVERTRAVAWMCRAEWEGGRAVPAALLVPWQRLCVPVCFSPAPSPHRCPCPLLHLVPDS